MHRTKIIKYESVVKETMLNLSKVKSDLKQIEIDVKDKYQLIKLNLFEFKTKIIQMFNEISNGEKMYSILK